MDSSRRIRLSEPLRRLAAARPQTIRCSLRAARSPACLGDALRRVLLRAVSGSSPPRPFDGLVPGQPLRGRPSYGVLAMQCSSLQCGILLHSSVFFFTMRYSSSQCGVFLHNAVFFFTMRYSSSRCGILLHDAVFFFTMRYSGSNR